MTQDDDLPVGERVRELVQHLGIAKAHFAAGTADELQALAEQYPHMVASLTLDGPVALHLPPELQSRLHVISGDDGPRAQNVARTVARYPDARRTVLKGYFQAAWSDIMADRAEEITPAMLDFLDRVSAEAALPEAALQSGEGEVAGITYRIQGSGPPLVLLPLAIAASQWQPLLPALQARYCTVSLGGPLLGAVGMLEDRGNDEGYQRMLANLVDVMQVQPGETILEVGCGSGVVDRWLARRTAFANPITAVDMNPYFLEEARALAKQEGLAEGVISFQEGKAEALQFPAGSFDHALSITVLEEGDAEQMLRELFRVTKPGGRVGVIVRAVDLPGWFNLPVGEELRAWLTDQRRGAGVSPGGCADGSLYQRFGAAGLVDVKGFPVLAGFGLGTNARRMKRLVRGSLQPEQTGEWDSAVASAEAAGTFFFAQPFHCAVGTKPA